MSTDFKSFAASGQPEHIRDGFGFFDIVLEASCFRGKRRRTLNTTSRVEATLHVVLEIFTEHPATSEHATRKCGLVHTLFAMEGDNDEDNLFDLEDDDEEELEPDISAVDDNLVASAEPMVGTIAGTSVPGVSSALPEDPEIGEEEEDEDRGMGSDPYNQNDWDYLGGAMGEEAETRRDRTCSRTW